MIFVSDSLFSFSAREMIKAAIMVNDFMNSILDKETIRMVVDAMSMETFNENEFIINEGDKGSHLYISADGIFQVIKAGSVMKSFGPGVVFGELAILYKAMRFASIKGKLEFFLQTPYYNDNHALINCILFFIIIF